MNNGVTLLMRRVAKDAVLKAGRIQKKSLGKKHQIHFKGEIDPVTEVDKACEKLIIGALKKHFPDHSILAEESGHHQTNSDYCWVLDPLDGTVNFSHGYPLFCVSLGLVFKGVIVMGFVYEPNLGELFFAEKGRGAFLNGKKIRVSKTKPLRRSLLVTGFPYDIAATHEPNVDRFKKFLLTAQAVRRDGVAAVDLAYVASGRFDGFSESGLKPWDVAAGILLVTEAGGKVSAYDGSPVRIDGEEIVASNGIIHPEMLAVLGS